jgi:NAD(P)-dependent dehydrogenase (short-subunit alcohol dehydrogenase family)
MHPRESNRCPQQVAGDVAYLLSDQAAWITSSVLSIDGGLVARHGLTAG